MLSLWLIQHDSTKFILIFIRNLGLSEDTNTRIKINRKPSHQLSNGLNTGSPITINSPEATPSHNNKGIIEIEMYDKERESTLRQIKTQGEILLNSPGTHQHIHQLTSHLLQPLQFNYFSCKQGIGLIRLSVSGSFRWCFSSTMIKT